MSTRAASALALVGVACLATQRIQDEDRFRSIDDDLRKVDRAFSRLRQRTDKLEKRQWHDHQHAAVMTPSSSSAE